MAGCGGGRRGPGPCGCFGITTEHGSQIFAIFDIITGLAIFSGFFAILFIGEFGDKKVYPSEKFNIPRQVVITFVFLGYYNAATGLFLYFSAGYRNRLLCILWILLNIPLAVVDFIKIYQIVVVYMLGKEIKRGGKGENIIPADNVEEKDTRIKLKLCSCCCCLSSSRTTGSQ